MSVFRLNSCCLCISLDVGAKIIGIVCTLFAAMIAVLYGVPAVMLRLPTATMIFYNVACVTSVLHFITGCTMICGLFQKRPSLMWPWLVLSWTVAGSLLLLSCAGTVMMYIGDPVWTISVVSSTYCVCAVILLYLTAVVRSRREEILDEIKWDSGKRLMRPIALEKNIYV